MWAVFVATVARLESPSRPAICVHWFTPVWLFSPLAAVASGDVQNTPIGRPLILAPIGSTPVPAGRFRWVTTYVAFACAHRPPTALTAL